MIEAERIVLRDEQGKVRATLSVSKSPAPATVEDNTVLSKGQIVAVPSLTIYDANGAQRARLEVMGLTFYYAGESAVSLRGGYGGLSGHCTFSIMKVTPHSCWATQMFPLFRSATLGDTALRSGPLASKARARERPTKLLPPHS